MRDARKYYGSDLVGYAWVAELQERGAVHYHILTATWRERAVFWDRKGIWEHGQTQTQKARSWGYVVKYAQKTNTVHGFPKGARLFAVWASASSLDEGERLQLVDTAQPNWALGIRDDIAPGERVRRFSDGQFAIGGQPFVSPVVPVGQLAVLMQKRLGSARWEEILAAKRECWGIATSSATVYNDGNQTAGGF